MPGDAKPYLNERDLARIRKAAESVEDGDLYSALHHVGHDCAKAEIERALKCLLPDEAYRQVVAVFKIAVED